MVKMDIIKKLIKTVIFTAYLKDEQPVNLLLVAPPDSGKSALMSRIITNKAILEVTDITAHGIAKMIAPVIEKGDVINHIIIPDFITVLAKNKSQSERTISFINNLIEEGIVNIASYLSHGIPFRMSEDARKHKIRCGMITGITEAEYQLKRKKLDNFGFISRFVVVRYRYSQQYLDSIFKEIWNGNYLHFENDVLELPKEKVKIEIDETEFMFQQIKLLVTNKLMEGKISSTGIRQVRMFKNLIQAIALINGRTKVTNGDYEEFLEFVPIINYAGKNIEQVLEN